MFQNHYACPFDNTGSKCNILNSAWKSALLISGSHWTDHQVYIKTHITRLNSPTPPNMEVEERRGEERERIKISDFQSSFDAKFLQIFSFSLVLFGAAFVIFLTTYFF
jgi:hypothetical protein